MNINSVNTSNSNIGKRNVISKKSFSNRVDNIITSNSQESIESPKFRTKRPTLIPEKVEHDKRALAGIIVVEV